MLTFSLNSMIDNEGKREEKHSYYLSKEDHDLTRIIVIACILFSDYRLKKVALSSID
jgi:hypothetical protein